MRLVLRDLQLPLRHPFTTSHGTLRTKRNLLVELHEGDHNGLGEAAPSLAYPQFNAEAIETALRALAPSLMSIRFSTPEALWDEMAPDWMTQPFALCALDLAAHDLWGKMQNQPVWKLWGLELKDLPLSNFTIGLDRLDTMIAKLREAAEWPIYKIKLGGSEDLAVMRALRRETDKPFRVDANTGWTVEQTLAYAPELRDLGVEFIEQPLSANDWQGMRRVFEECALPVIADESAMFSRNQLEAQQGGRADAGTADDRTRAGARAPRDGRLHDRELRRHFRPGAVAAVAGCSGHGWRGTARGRPGGGRSTRSRTRDFPQRARAWMLAQVSPGGAVWSS
jgi:L-alanine-DL-glutamate epimerase-like enolase superfamily enzyme